MTTTGIRTRLRVALRSLPPSEQAEVLQLALALDEHADVAAATYRTAAGARSSLALLTRAALRGDDVPLDLDAVLPRILDKLITRTP